tara:strand:+ start:1321 stop:2979 length:1659 start_codon:yes stop_codon:yes gene_type:complete
MSVKITNGVVFYNGNVVTGSKRDAVLAQSRASQISTLNRTTSRNGRQFRVNQINEYNKELGLPPLDHTALEPGNQISVLTGNSKVDSPNGVDMRQRGDGSYYVPNSAIERGENEIVSNPVQPKVEPKVEQPVVEQPTLDTVVEQPKVEEKKIITSSETAAANVEKGEFDYVGTRLDNSNIEKQEGRSFGEVQSEIGQLNKNKQLLNSDFNDLQKRKNEVRKIHGRDSDEYKAIQQQIDDKEQELLANNKKMNVLKKEREEIALAEAEKVANAETTEEPVTEEDPTANLTEKQKKAINPEPEVEEEEEEEEELGNVNPEPELDRETGDPGERKPPGNNRDEVITTPDETPPVEDKTPPEEEKKEADTKPYVPPVIIQHPEDGTFFMGRERDDKVTRKRDIQLIGSQSNSLRLFHDGGFELKSSEDAGGTSGSSILQVVDDAPLLIKSKGDIRIQCDGRFSVVAHDIKMKAEGADDTGGITLKSEHDITLDAANRAIIKGENVVLDAKDKVISYSEGWTFLVGQVVRIHEPKSQLIPDMLGKYIHTQTQPLKTN